MKALHDLIYNPFGFYRSLFRRALCAVTGRGVTRSGQCMRCGRCCRNITLVYKKRAVSSERQFAAIVRDRPEFRRLRPNGHRSRGRLDFDCTWLLPDNTCRDYRNRLQICRDYPDTDLYFSVRSQHSDCGYRFAAPKPSGARQNRKQKGAQGDNDTPRRGDSAGGNYFLSSML